MVYLPDVVKRFKWFSKCVEEKEENRKEGKTWSYV